MSQKSPQKKKNKKKKREREKMYLMYYLNEDGKRVYTLKVRRDYYYRAFVCLFVSFVVRWGRRVALFVVISRARVGPEEDFVGFFFGLEFFYIILSLSDDFFPSL